MHNNFKLICTKQKKDVSMPRSWEENDETLTWSLR